MRSTGRYGVACALFAFGLVSPTSASLYLSRDAGSLCAAQSMDPAGCLAGLGLAATAVGNIAAPLLPVGELASVSPGAETVAAEARVGEFAALQFADPSTGTAVSGAASLLFWVFGSGLLGSAFVARRRKADFSRA